MRERDANAYKKDDKTRGYIAKRVASPFAESASAVYGRRAGSLNELIQPRDPVPHSGSGGSRRGLLVGVTLVAGLRGNVRL